MDKTGYIDKMNHPVSDGTIYRALNMFNKDPTTSLEQKIGKTIKELKDQNKLAKESGNISNAFKKHSISPRIHVYDLPKRNKENMPLRPIVSSIN